MSRLVTIALVFVACLAAFVAAVLLRAGDDVMETGVFLRPTRVELGVTMRQLEEKDARVVWLGDSTVLDSIDIPSYADIVAERIARSGDEMPPHGVVAMVGLDFYHYYCMLGRILERKPEVVVLVAHLRMFVDGARAFMDLCSFLPASELPRAMLLPFRERDVGPLDLLGYQLLRLPGAETSFLAFEGAQRLFQDKDPTGLLAKTPTYFERLGMGGRKPALEYLRSYALDLDREHPVVRMMGATVDMARRRGAEVLVVASPIPYEKLEARGWYQPQTIDVLRRVVEENGGHFFDGHRVLQKRHYRDESGHYTTEGAEILAEALEPTMREVLEDRASPGRATEAP